MLNELRIRVVENVYAARPKKAILSLENTVSIVLSPSKMIVKKCCAQEHPQKKPWNINLR
eukprot:Awhi_evm1s5183